MMKRFFSLAVCVFIISIFAACDDGEKPEQGGSPEGGESTIEQVGQPAGKIPEGKKLDAVCTYEGLWLRNMPTNKNESGFKWVAGLKLGDKITYLGETTKLDGKEDAWDMIKVQDLTGNVGWIPFANSVVDAVPAVVKSTTKQYSTPQLTSDTGKKIDAMTVLGVINNSRKDDFIQVAIYGTYPFWIAAEEISTADYDVAMARLYTLAKNQFDAGNISKQKYLEKLDEIRSDKLLSDSIFLPAIDEEYQKILFELESEPAGDEEEVIEESG
ncbi:MAG: hypothetical protein JW822_06910 [Spirochaetales bacterium]|nr:hypothetical protein [Spirochaetales bacterium]